VPAATGNPRRGPGETRCRWQERPVGPDAVPLRSATRHSSGLHHDDLVLAQFAGEGIGLAGRKQSMLTRADRRMARSELTDPLPVFDQCGYLGSLVLGPVHRAAGALIRVRAAGAEGAGAF